MPGEQLSALAAAEDQYVDGLYLGHVILHARHGWPLLASRHGSATSRSLEQRAPSALKRWSRVTGCPYLGGTRWARRDNSRMGQRVERSDDVLLEQID